MLCTAFGSLVGHPTHPTHTIPYHTIPYRPQETRKKNTSSGEVVLDKYLNSGNFFLLNN